jgi:hypothetical protein
MYCALSANPVCRGNKRLKQRNSNGRDCSVPIFPPCIPISDGKIAKINQKLAVLSYSVATSGELSTPSSSSAPAASIAAKQMRSWRIAFRSEMLGISSHEVRTLPDIGSVLPRISSTNQDSDGSFDKSGKWGLH